MSPLFQRKLAAFLRPTKVVLTLNVTLLTINVGCLETSSITRESYTLHEAQKSDSRNEALRKIKNLALTDWGRKRISCFPEQAYAYADMKLGLALSKPGIKDPFAYFYSQCQVYCKQAGLGWEDIYKHSQPLDAILVDEGQQLTISNERQDTWEDQPPIKGSIKQSLYGAKAHSISPKTPAEALPRQINYREESHKLEKEKLSNPEFVANLLKLGLDLKEFNPCAGKYNPFGDVLSPVVQQSYQGPTILDREYQEKWWITAMNSREDLRMIVRAAGFDPATYNPYSDKLNWPQMDRFVFLKNMKLKNEMTAEYGSYLHKDPIQQTKQPEPIPLDHPEENVWQMPNSRQKTLGAPLMMDGLPCGDYEDPFK